ncbi:hypothetical protein FB192DRAFT_1439607 [Mucor lusitanicus]|uniref:Uncharacterized protein n=2 Tax=Mucor circinelloides f. lusitanicus TaxID=29924 RepID=A0A168NYV3_MUCCL|nr:hypothetical protein FB192DRAFT_1439607 [Mucor lusitanicus]OAD06921.1 hypothetical protein MUCCIDRAFT_160539 [Mucor lusitanicus CBS 277.49]
MTELYSNFYGNEQFSYHHLTLPQEKPQRRLSFSTLLQKRPSLMGRKVSIFGRQKKPELKLVIPSTVKESTHLSRVNTSMTGSSMTTDEDGPETPTSSTSPAYDAYQHRSSTVSSVDLETAITTPSDSPVDPLMDYSGKGYSNFYIKLPNGNWMVRIRDGNRKIVGTYELDGSMI